MIIYLSFRTSHDLNRVQTNILFSGLNQKSALDITDDIEKDADLKQPE
jgi:hypothetical protein